MKTNIKNTLGKASFIFAFSSFLFISCDKQEVESFDSQKDTPITILSAGVADLSTRAGTPAGTLTSGSLSFFFNNNSGDNARYVADCEKWTYKNGKWQFDETGSDNQQLLWKGAGNAIPWIATYPYRDDSYSYITNDAGGMDEKVPADQTDETKWTEFDILWATGTAMSSSIEIEFKHLYTKFSVNLTYGTEVDATQTIESVTVGGTCIVRNFNYASQIWGITLSDITDIKSLALETPNYIDANDESKGTYNASFEALILPQTAAPKLTIVMSDGRVFATTLTEQEFKSGYQYNIKLKVGQDKVELGGITAAEWGEPVDGGLLETL
ncbi:MAG: fimbrillin family protein [Bacteroidales bacterium]|nr:fimbrillin family protein [Bacteroidales bacterium]